ncbi:MAG: 4-demethylwyosine synthase TYW1 [Candidatus Diapherotrites archaeon]|nr:4-demethylwyosine synthase TYW1 [Candidatus Diapherotrites archaeon]
MLNVKDELIVVEEQNQLDRKDMLTVIQEAGGCDGPIETVQTSTGTQQIMLPDWKRKRLENQQYRLVGNHSAVKICHWCKAAVRGNQGCYKDTFYGVETDKCLEMSPAITCNKRCLHCWRDTTVFSRGWIGVVDDPKFIVEGCIEERRKLLMGFKGNPAVNKEQFEDLLKPTHAAISLTGEPCMYPRLPEMIDEFFEHDFKTVFLVTSGTVPERLRELNQLPTNLYISNEAYTKEMYKQLCLPVIENAWENYLESLDIMRTMDTRTVMRITCMQGKNMDNPQGFLHLIDRGQPKYIECKSYMHVGYSRERLSEKNMPAHKDIELFSKEIEANSNYKIVDEREDSRIFLLKRS